MKRIGVYVCECGPNIADKIDIDKVIKAVSPVIGVTAAARHRLLCSADGKEFLEKMIKENKLTHLVLGACSHKQHEATFMKVCSGAGINPYLFHLVNIREQCAWITPDREEATSKTVRCIKAGISRVKYQQALEKKYLESNVDVLVIGGGITGVQASLLLASNKRKVYLVEKAVDLGGWAVKFEKLYQGEEYISMIKKKIAETRENENIEVFTGSMVREVLGFFGNFLAKIKKGNQENVVRIGAIVVATGCKLLDPGEITKYGYGRYDNIYTSLEFELMNNGAQPGLKNDKSPQSAAIVHCVGRQEKGYCSEICCLYAAKFHDYLKGKIVNIKIYDLYYDFYTPGFDAADKQVTFIQISDIEISEKNGKKLIEYKQGKETKGSIEVDLVILLPAVEPGEDVTRLAEILNISLDEKGFFIEEHVKLNPVAASLEGIFIAGCAQGPKDIFKSITQSEAVCGKILSSLVPGKKLEPQVMVSRIAGALCRGCQTCLSVCAYGAINYDEAKGVCVTNEVLCRGCGNCASACPSDAITHKHFTSRQIYQELIEVL